MNTSFYELSFLTAPGEVFTPRATTEALVDAALGWLAGAPARVADVGTGAGVIAVALASSAPRVEVWATDASERAVEVARANAARHGVADRVHVLHGDLLDRIPAPIDLIVANLPYLPPARAADFPDEPADAVVSPGDGLTHYRRLLADAGHLLAPGGAVLLQLEGRVVEATPALLAA